MKDTQITMSHVCQNEIFHATSKVAVVMVLEHENAILKKKKKITVCTTINNAQIHNCEAEKPEVCVIWKKPEGLEQINKKIK